MKKKLLFFTEYSKKIGKGHFYRTKQVFNKVSNKNNCKLFINKDYRFINNILNDKSLPVYGDGNYTRDWLYVIDHAIAIDLVFHQGRNAET